MVRRFRFQRSAGQRPMAHGVLTSRRSGGGRAGGLRTSGARTFAWVLLGAVVASGCSGGASVDAPNTVGGDGSADRAVNEKGEASMARLPTIAGVRDLGVIANPKGTNFGRDGASSCTLGGKLLYAFGDTLFFTKAADGTSYRTNTAAVAELTSPTVLNEPLDANGFPSQFIPFTANEIAYNQAAGDTGNDRIGLWPGRCVTLPDGTGLVFFDKLKIKNGEFEFLGMGAAKVTKESTTATRLPDLLFAPPEPDFFHGALVDHGFLYLYSCTKSPVCQVGRAPVGQATRRASYTFWDGSSWTPDLTRAVASVPGAASGFSVAYNAYLGAYVSFTSYGVKPNISMRVAPSPVGPWSDAIDVFTFPGNVYAVEQHTALAADGGRRVFVSAFRSLGDLRGDIHLLQVDLTKGRS